MARRVRIEPMAEGDWPEVRRIYAEGIATGDATLRDARLPDWSHLDRSHRPRCRLVARDPATGTVVGWAALSARYSARRVYAGVAWESVYVGGRGARPRRRARSAGGPDPGVRGGRLLDAARQGSSSRTRRAWPSTSASASAASASRSGSGAGCRGRWRDVVLLERRSATVGQLTLIPLGLNVRPPTARHSG